MVTVIYRVSNYFFIWILAKYGSCSGVITPEHALSLSLSGEVDHKGKKRTLEITYYCPLSGYMHEMSKSVLFASRSCVKIGNARSSRTPVWLKSSVVLLSG